MGSRSGAAGAERDLGSRSRATRKQAQGREVEAGGSGCLCGQSIRDQKRRGIIGSKKSGVDQYKGRGWEEE